ncbi:type I-E CRISPR-associated protein Cse2/CasB [Streptomyces sp. NPDC006654]|uniref:type I-E CRISPR-associated protein Cse2/CasB n=1 Tax=Streptomyces sp. NPDC006654 TaxID=3156897 RepID=UPI0033C1AF85
MTTTAPALSRPSLYRAFVNHIETRCAQDPGVRVALRKGLRRDLDDVRGLHRIVAAWLPDGCPQAEERAFYAVAAMIADRPRHTFHTPGDHDDPDATAPAGREPTAPPAGQAEAAATQPTRRDSLGASYARAVLAQAGRGLAENTAEARLNLLTRQSLPGIHRHLPGSIRHLRDAGADIDFAVLLDDLATWPYRSKTTARRWLKDYYRTRRAPLETAAQMRDNQSDDLTDTD